MSIVFPLSLSPFVDVSLTRDGSLGDETDANKENPDEIQGIQNIRV